MRFSVALTVVALIAGRDSAAQQVAAGTKIRFNAPTVFDGWRVANMAGFAADSLRVAYSPGDTALIPVAKIAFMDESRGRHAPLWAKLSAFVLTPVGAVGGLTTGFLFAIADTEYDDEDAMLWGAGVGAALGLATGIGLAASYKPEVWSPVVLPGSRWYQPATTSGLIATSGQSHLRFKLRVAGRKVQGTFVEQRGDTIELSKNASHTNIPIALISDVRVSRGKSRLAGAKYGALWGLGVGTLTSAFVAAGPNDNNDVRTGTCDTNGVGCEYESDFTTVAAQGFGYAVVGAAIGAVIGHEQWDRAPLPTHSDEPARRLLLVPRRDGIRIGVQASF